MKIASALSVALVAGLSVATWTSLASAQLPAGYGAAAAKCRAQMRAAPLEGPEQAHSRLNKVVHAI
jgi:hypothetical protein